MKLFCAIAAAAVLVSGAAQAQVGRQAPAPYNAYQQPAPHEPPAQPYPYAPSQYGTQPPQPYGGINPYQTDCATGFSKTNASGSYYTCITPPIACPGGAALSAPQARYLQYGRTAQFWYYCGSPTVN